MAGKKRRHRTPQGQLEDDLLCDQRWSGLRQQDELQKRSHSDRENCMARRRCREFLEGGWGSIDWVDVYGEK